MKNNALIALLIGSASLALTSCKEDIDTSDRYTYTEETIASYLEKHEEYSQYCELLGQVPISQRSESTVWQLLSARGNYTVFAPTNEAIDEYLSELCEKGIISSPTWQGFDDDVTLDSIQKIIVYNSVIDGGDDTDPYETGSFPGDTEEFLIANMNDRKLTVNYGIDPDSIYINGNKDDQGNVIGGSLIDLHNRDIFALNGYIHQVHSVVAPSNETLADILTGYVDQGTEGYLVMAKLVLACGLKDTLNRIKDETYENLYLTDALTVGHGYLPQHRKFGFTIFAEPDDFWRQQLGKEPRDISPEDVEQWVVSKGLYPNAKDNTDYEATDNALNQFVTYHILPMRIPVDKLVIHYNEKGYYYATSTRYSIPVWELYTTMGERRLIKLYQCTDVDGIYLNRFPTLDNGRHGTYHELSCDADKEGFIVNTSEALGYINGYIYPISPVGSQGPVTLSYTQDTRENFQKQRLRFDVAGFFPELMSNDIRANRVATDENQSVGFPETMQYNYLENVTIEEGSIFSYLLGLGKGWQDYQGDEIYVTGRYEMTFLLPPVPVKGTYELRYAVQNNSNKRGMCQVYFGSDTNNLYAMGIPLDLRIGGTSDLLGWEADTDDDDYNAEIDKRMRNNGFMKGPEHYHAGTGSSGTARESQYTTRRIIVRQDMDPDTHYYLKFKSVLEDDTKEFFMDYIELCAKEVYDNPQTPEDIW
ncbi:MAG: fasciclin domain-containing protein [Prevotellaceae bacterium]|nr:fasciclin domain-containing protein [Prevotellaceae bacterium]